MSKFRAGLLGAVTLGLGMLAAGSPAYAITNFTWNPAYPGGISTNTSGNAQFSADKVTIADYARINIPAIPTVPGSISETGTLVATSFVNLTGTNAGFVPGTGTGIGIPGATPYQLYITFTSTSHFTTFIPNVAAIGVFDSVTYTLWGDTGGNCTFSPTASPSCGGDLQVALANGALSNLGLNQVSIISGIPAANVQLDFNPLVPGFFVAPTNVTLQMEGAFTNTPGATSSNCGPSGVSCSVTINGGGGNLDFLATPNRVPEPGTLWLLGAGLLGLAGISRKRARR